MAENKPTRLRQVKSNEYSLIYVYDDKATASKSEH